MSSQPDEALAGEPAPAPVSQPEAASPTRRPVPAVSPTEPAFAAPAVSQVRRPAGAVGPLPWKVTAEGKTVFRRGAPLLLWWLWVAFAVFNLLDVAIPDHDYFSVELAAGLLAVTAVVYACALRPRVVADDDAIYVYNPYRDHTVRWGAVNGVFLGDSVEVTCARPSPKQAATVYCWALYSGRRSRRRGELRAERREARFTGRTAAETGELRQPDATILIAGELGRRSTAAKQRGVPPATLESRWAWLPVAYLAGPAIALIALVLAR
jgi:hypothetical protein